MCRSIVAGCVGVFHIRGFVDAVHLTDDGEPEGMDGEPEGMDDALTKLLDRYPWLADGDADAVEASTPKKSARRVGGTKKPDGGESVAQMDRATLERRMPALRKHRARGG
jgi:hypothetical protein